MVAPRRSRSTEATSARVQYTSTGIQPVLLSLVAARVRIPIRFARRSNLGYRRSESSPVQRTRISPCPNRPVATAGPTVGATRRFCCVYLIVAAVVEPADPGQHPNASRAAQPAARRRWPRPARQPGTSSRSGPGATAIRQELRRIGANLNQAVRLAHAGRDSDLAATVDAARDAVARRLA